MVTITRRVMQLTQRYRDYGMSLIEARKKALERANFEREVEKGNVTTYIMGL